MSMNSRSFTIEFEFSLTNAASNTTRQCLFLVSTGGNLDIEFFNDDTIRSNVIQSNPWYHATFVYDNDKRQRFIYIDGNFNTQSATSVGPYLGPSGLITVDDAGIYRGLDMPCLTGLMGDLTVSIRAKTACEILNYLVY